MKGRVKLLEGDKTYRIWNAE